LTEEQIAEQKAAVESMKNAKNNMQKVLDRHTALMYEIEKWVLLGQELKKFVPDMFESKHHDETPLIKLSKRIAASKVLL
jgi:hypothetical protein